MVAVSGGPDSLCLLHLLRRLESYQLHVAHLDHGLRPGSQEESAFVRDTAVEWGLPVTVDRRDVEALIKGGRGEEEAGRIARYQFLAQVAREVGAAVVVTGHTASDQAETILMNLLRGAGPQGLAGMRPERDFADWKFVDVEGSLRLVRPLLEVSRWETQVYCAEHGLEPRIDPTNFEREHLRSRIRLELMPILAEYQPALEDVLGRTGKVMNAVSDLLDSLVETEIGRSVRSAGPAALAIELSAFKSLHQVLRWELMRAVMATLAEGGVEADFETVSEASRAMVRGLDGRHDLVAGLELERAGPEIVMRKRGARVRFPDVPQIEREGALKVPGRAELADRWEVEATRTELDPEQRERIITGEQPWADPLMEAVDLASVAGGLQLRRPREGDRFRPLGMHGSMTLAEFFISQGVPRLQRRRWPLVTNNQEEIVWVVGLRIAQPFRVTAETQEVLRLNALPPEPNVSTNAGPRAAP